LRSDFDVWSQRFVEESRIRLGGNLASIILVGSAARGDFVDGFSDLDLLFILRSDDEAIEIEALQRISELKERYEREQGIRYGINVLPESSLFSQTQYPRVNPLALHEFTTSGKALYGTDIGGVRLPNFGSPAIKRFALGDILEARSVLTAYASHLNAPDRSSLELALRHAIWCTFRAAKAYLVTEGELDTGKDAILRKFRAISPRPALSSALGRVGEARDHWDEVRVSGTLLLDRYRDSLDFVNGLADLVQGHSSRPRFACATVFRPRSGLIH